MISAKHYGRGWEEIKVDGWTIPVVLKRNSRARRFILRLDASGRVLLTLPVRASSHRALEFARSQTDWIRDKLAGHLPPVCFANGAKIPIRGQLHLIVHEPETLGNVRLEEPGKTGLSVVRVAGKAHHLSRCLKNWLKSEAKKELVEASQTYARMLGLRIRKVSVRDTSTRWGSCSSQGHLSFSWRLILAPSFVLHYVAAHEIAHLVEMNHSRRFWSVVRKLNPDVERAKQWIRKHGRELHRYGNVE